MGTIQNLINSEIKNQIRDANSAGGSKRTLLLVAGTTFLLTTILMVLLTTAGKQGHFHMTFPGGVIDYKINRIHLESLLTKRQHDPGTRVMVKQLFSLYDMDDELMNAIENLPYNNRYAKLIRRLRDTELGPFDAPQVPVELSFSANLKPYSADVCPDSDFRDKGMNIVVADRTEMKMINHVTANNLISMSDCPVKDKLASNLPERVIVSQKFAESLFDTSALPSSVTATARAVSGQIIIPPTTLE